MMAVAMMLLLRFGGEEAIAEDLRMQIFANSWAGLVDRLPFGAGLGSFVPVYPLYEAPEQIARYYINSAHNEYLEFLLETGLPGLALLALLGLALLRGFARTPFAQATFLALLGLMVHSMLEYPLRTYAIVLPAMWMLAIVLSEREHAAPEARMTATGGNGYAL